MSKSRHLGRYLLVAELARGGMGVVYLAISSGVGGFNKVLVLKELKPELVEDAGFLEMFLEEARLAAQLSHPNIVTTYEVGIEDNRPFIVMDYLEGQTFARALKRGGDKFTRPMQLRVLALALDGLHYAHTREALNGTAGSVVHRDVSPQNIFVTYDGQVRVVDFGIAKASDTTVETRAGVFKGKPSYMAPEQLRGEPDGRADVFSVGVILWEILAGRRMWPKKTDVEILTSLLRSEIPSIDELAPEAPAELLRICKKATAIDIGERYATAHAMRNDIDAYLSSIDDRTSLVDLGSVVAGVFAEERAKIRKLVEKAISDSKAALEDSRAKLPSIAPPPDETSHPSGAHAEPISSATPATSSLGTPGGAAIALDRSMAPPKRSKAPYVLIALAALGVAVFAGTKLRTGDENVVAAKNAPPATMTTSAAPPSTPPAVVASPPPSTPPAVVATQPAPTPSPLAVPAAPKPTPAPVVVHAPVAPKPVAEPARPAATPSAPKTDCNPPFYFEGTKKLFKPGCL